MLGQYARWALGLQNQFIHISFKNPVFGRKIIVKDPLSYLIVDSICFFLPLFSSL